MSGFISSDQITGTALKNSDRSAVVLIHGWNPDGYANKFADGDWPQLVSALHTRLNNTGWKLLLFHWESDANTGPAIDVGIFGITGFANAREAANNAFLNGSRLADLLNQSSPDLRKVVFIAHSAGSWAAYRAADKLLQSNPYVVVNVVLLDPFIPGVDPSIVTSLTTATISQLALHSSTDRIYRLENYYANDATDVDFDWGNGGGRKATSQIFVWRSRDINHRVDYNSTLGFYYDGHGGPIRFFADTVVTTAGPPVPNGLAFAPWDFASVGYYRGLVNEGFLLPSIVTQPQATPPTPQGDTATLSVVANRATSYLWFRNGVSTGVTTPSINLLANSANEGDYVVRVQNNAGLVFSEKARFTVATAASRPTITSVSPRNLTGLPLPQTQRITILGTLFSSSSRLTFFDGVNTYSGRVPLSISSTELKFDIAVGPNAANWTVKVVNGAVESDPFSFSVTSAVDTTAPSAPAGLSATRWASGNQFLLDWTNPSDPSGIAKAWVKIGSTPISPTDGVAYLLPANKPLQVALPLSSGSQSVHLWLEDGSGNRNQNNRATITIGTDVTSPVVLITSPSANPLTTTQGSVVLNGSYGDDLSGVVSVLWQNFPTGSGAATLTSSGLGGTWATPAITLRPGLNIIGVTATDAAGNVGSRTIQITYVDTSNSSSATVTITPQGAIDQGAQWRINGGPWRNSGFTEQNVPVGPRFVEFMNIPGGYSTPAGFSVNVIAGQNVSASGNYTPIFVAAPPNTPSNPSPAHGAVNVGRAQPRFSWSGAAPGGDLQYAFCIDLANPANPDPPVYFGFGSLNDNSFRFPDTSFALPSATTINWRVKARANGITVDGPVWRFTTEYAVADLVVKDLALDGNVEPGASVTLNATIVNQGSFLAPLGYLYFYLSRTPGGKEIRLNLPISLIVRELLPGNSTNITFSAKLDGLPAGQSFIDAWVDTTAYGPTGEASLENNLTSIQLNYVDGKNPEVSYLGLANVYPKTGVGMNIIYTAKDDVGIATVDFYYSTDGGTNWIPIQEGYVPPAPPTYGAGFAWQIPSNAPLTTNLFVRAVARDASGNAGERIAGPYTLRDGTVPTVTILSPNGGEVLDMGSSYQIRWSITASSPLNYATLYFYRNGTADVLTNVVNLTNGAFLWTVPNNFATTTGKIRIVAEDVNGNNGDDYSDGFFTVRDTTAPPPAPWTTPNAITSTVGGDPGGLPKIVADRLGVEHLIYGLSHDENTHRVSFRYRKRTNGSWGSATLVNLDSQLVDAAVGSDYFIGSWRFAVDNSGNPHIVWTTSFSSFANINKQEVYYSYFNGSTWAAPVALSSSILGGYNVNRVSWSAKAGMPVAASGAAAAVVNGKLYVVGGSFFLRTYEYDPNANTWNRKADMPGGGLSDGGAASIGSKIYAVGNPFDGNIRIYDQPSDTWSQGATIPSRRQGVRLAAVNGKIYAIGGYLYSDGTRSAKIEMYDPASNSWSTKSDMPTARGYAAVAVVGDKIYVIGGDGNGGGSLRTIEIYDPVNDAWSTPVIQAGANWPYSRGGVASVLNGRIYLAGGDTSRTVQEYDPASNTWQPMSSMLSAQQFSCGGAVGSKFYVISGYDESGSTVSAVEEATVFSSVVGAVSGSPSIATDLNDAVHVTWDDGAYYQPDGNSPIGLAYAGQRNIFYSAKTGQSWSAPLQVTTGGAYGPSMALSRSNDIYVAYSFGMRSIATVKRNGSGWSAPTLVTTNSDGYISLAATTNAFPQIVWSLVSNQPTNQLLYSSFDGTAWSPAEALAATRYGGTPSTLTIDSLGRPHVTWEPKDYPAILLYRSKFGGQWTPTTRLNLNSQNVIQSTSDATLSLVNDELHVVWNSSVNGNVEVLYNHASVGSTNDVFAPGVTVTSPAAGTSLSVGSNVNVQWSASDNVGVAAVHLHYSTNSGGSWVLIATNQPNSGTYAWTVPNLGTNAGQIRVTAQDAANNAGVGFSGSFVTADLTAPTVVIVAPTNGAFLSGGTTTNILWTATDNVAVASVDLEYSLNNGISWSALATGLNNTGVYAWSVPNIATTLLQIRATVHDTAGLSSSATVQPLTIIRVSAPPVQPNSPFPLNFGTAVSVSPALQWRSGSPDGAALSFNVRFGTAQNPPAVGAASQMSFSPGALNYLTTYYWQIEATDGVSTNIGPVWSFTTEAMPPNSPPSITEQPASQTLNVGQSATFSVITTGTGPLAYQWFFNATNAMANATNAALILTNVQLANAGSYSVVVTNIVGSVTSVAAMLTVTAGAPTITTSPTNAMVIVGSNATFYVTATGTGPLAYQWILNATNLLAGATNAALTLTNVQPAQAGGYRVVVSNAAGSATSAEATLAVLVPPAITGQPSNQTVNAGQNASFSVTVSGTSPLTYQWFFNTTNRLNGATNATLTLNSVNANDAGSYTVTVTNVAGLVTGNTATLTVSVPPFITQQPSNQTASVGSSVTFTVVVAGIPAPNYQWRKNAINIPGANTASYRIAGVTPGDAGTYDVVASNSAGSATSYAAILTVSTGAGNPVFPLPVPVRPASFPLSASTRSGTVIGWGDNGQGQIGIPTALGRVVAIAAGYDSSLAVKSDGTVTGWGYNGNGEISLPAGLTGVVAVAAGRYHGLALKNDGKAVGWGYNFYGVDPPAGLTGVVAVAAGWSHNLALKIDGSVVAWGLGDNGQASVPGDLTGVVAVAAGAFHSLALKSDGTVVGWGQTSVPAGLTGVVAIAAGRDHSVALKSDGRVTAWGSDFYGESSGAGSVTGAVAVAAGAYHSLAVKIDGTIAAWGWNVSGQTAAPGGQVGGIAVAGGGNHSLAIISPAITTQPQSQTMLSGGNCIFSVMSIGITPFSYQWRYNEINIVGATNASLSLTNVQAANSGNYDVVVTNSSGSITSTIATLTVLVPPTITIQPASQILNAGQDTSFSVTATGTSPLSYQWRKDGTNLTGATGATFNLAGVQTNQAGTYTVVVSNAAGSATSAPPAVLTVNVASAGMVIAWGGNDFGQTSVPDGLSGVKAIAAGFGHTIALKSEGNVVAWGRNNYGQTVVPAGLNGVATIAAGEGHAVALRSDGSVVAWGRNDRGQASVPAAAQSGVIAIAAGEAHTLALKSDGSVVGWGHDFYGQSTVPTAAQSGVIAIAACGAHNVALKNNGTVVAWGYNGAGESNVPNGLSGVVAVAAGENHNIALKADGTVVAWGDNQFGQGAVPVGLGGVVAMAAGGYHNLALKQDGTVVAWGLNSDGQLNIPVGLSGVMAIAAGERHTVVLVRVLPPNIIVQPTNQTVNAGQNASFSVTVTGNGIGYQWLRNATYIDGQTTSTLTISNVNRLSAGTYSVVVTNAGGSVTSSNVLLWVRVPQRFATNNVRWLGDGRFRLLFGDHDGGPLTMGDTTRFVVEATTNFVNWVPLTNSFVITNGQVQMEDSTSSNFPRRFYRVIEW